MFLCWKRFPLPLMQAGLVGFAQAAPLTFDAALKQAENISQTLAAQRAQVDVAQSTPIPTGTLSDPKLYVGVDNYPVSGPMHGSLTQDFMTMQKVGVMQTFPNADKRRARGEAVSAEIGFKLLELDYLHSSTAASLYFTYGENE